MTSPSPEERMADLERMIGDYPRHVAELSERITALAQQTVTGRDADELVTVTANARGQIRSVRVTRRALTELDGRRLATCVMEAVNDALRRAEAQLSGTTVAESDTTEVDARLAAFEARIDDTLYELDRMNRMLDRLDT